MCACVCVRGRVQVRACACLGGEAVMEPCCVPSLKTTPRHCFLLQRKTNPCGHHVVVLVAPGRCTVHVELSGVLMVVFGRGSPCCHWSGGEAFVCRRSLCSAPSDLIHESCTTLTPLVGCGDDQHHHLSHDGACLRCVFVRICIRMFA